MRSVAKSTAGITTKNDRIDPCVAGTPRHHVFVKTRWVLRTPLFPYLWNLISHSNPRCGTLDKVYKSLKFALHLKSVTLIAGSIA